MTQSTRPVGPGDHVFLVDGSSFVFRAYFQSIRQDQKYNYRSDRLPVGAVRLFATKILQFLRDGAAGIKPTHLAIIFDKSENSFRREIYPPYKANRPDPPQDLAPQFPLMRETVSAFGLTPIEQDRYEADDLIATYARQARERGADVLIVSADKDLMQLIEPGVAMFDPASGDREERRIGPDEVVAYFGAGADKVVDIQALAGDSTDNVPGARGVGVKTAAQLIGEYGDLDTLLAHAGEIKQPKRREALTDPQSVALIRLSKTLVTLVRDVDVAVPLDTLGVPKLDGAPLIAFLKAMEFTTITRRVGEICGLDANAIEPDARFLGPGGWRARNGETIAPSLAAPAASPAPPDKPAAPVKATGERTPKSLAAERAARARKERIDVSAYATVATAEALQGWIARAFAEGLVAFDTETSSLDPLRADLVGVSLAVAPGEACYIPIGHRAGAADLFGGGGLLPGQIAEAEAIALLKPLLEDASVLKIGQNVKFDWHVFARRDVEVAPFDDTMLISYALDSGASGDGHGMDALAERWLGHKTIHFGEVAGSGRNFIGFARVAIDKATQYAAEDADVTLRLWRVLKPRLVAEAMTTVYETLERPLIVPLALMERRGVAIDREMLSRLSGEFAQGMARIEAEIQKLVGAPFNLSSPKQLGDILFGQMGLPGGKKTATGAWSTSASVLEDLAEEGHELPARILDWRQLAKLKSTYTDALPGFVDPRTNRVHTSYALASTTTGRLSSSDPNLQNIPVRNEEGRKIRRAFVAAPGCKLISADYSQIELRLLAHVAD
ncbi:MAG: DNA polymerase I, partial [Roseiarcus sp.]